MFEKFDAPRGGCGIFNLLGQYDLSPHRGHWPFINWKINLLIGGGA